jgi:hypothetical protein
LSIETQGAQQERSNQHIFHHFLHPPDLFNAVKIK